ncbi:hypothetical protein TNCT_691511 [Trichonephila clavata]|uniref:Uncharacterized protein n=1 Tax=Trichonephila clavata TaxID=2740835 RepID=A0A8X6G9G6_TRICU|nr:hypothetical protein TNCT_691511 [Trichonephila clavata]
MVVIEPDLHVQTSCRKGGWNEKHSRSFDFSQEQARMKARGSVIQSPSFPHQAVRFFQTGRCGSYSLEKIAHFSKHSTA